MADGGPLGGAPNSFVAQEATELSIIPLEEVTLVGVAGPDDALRAMIRMSDGSIVTGGLGDRLAIGKLIEIGTAGVVVELASGFATFLRPYPWGRDPPPA